MLDGLGVRHVHLGQPDALFRRRRDRTGLRGGPGGCCPSWTTATRRSGSTSTWAGCRGADAELLGRITSQVEEVAAGAAVFAPLGVGRHVDHLLARSVGELLGATLYADFPYTARDPAGEEAAAGELQPWAWTADLAAKVPVIAGYRTQVDALFPDGGIPVRPETYYAPPG